ncbi:hypothetical protein ABIA40_000224 [Bradyrhizobium sp. USDA 223]
MASPINTHELRNNVSVLEGSGGNIGVLTGSGCKVLIDAGPLNISMSATRPCPHSLQAKQYSGKSLRVTITRISYVSPAFRPPLPNLIKEYLLG